MVAAAVAVAGVVGVGVVAHSVVVPERQVSVGMVVVEVGTGSMRAAVCSEAMSSRMVLNETRRKKRHGTASRTTTKSFACGLQASETS